MDDLTVNTDAVLAKCADKIRKLSKGAVEILVDNAIEIGHQLTIAKEAAGHGHWGLWLEREFPKYTDRHALNFMNLYEMSLKSENAISDLKGNVDVSSLFLLAAPSTSDEARTEVLDRVEAGEEMPVAKVREVVQRGKKPATKKSKPKKPAEPAEPVVIETRTAAAPNWRSDSDQAVVLGKPAKPPVTIDLTPEPAPEIRAPHDAATHKAAGLEPGEQTNQPPRCSFCLELVPSGQIAIEGLSAHICQKCHGEVGKLFAARAVPAEPAAGDQPATTAIDQAAPVAARNWPLEAIEAARAIAAALTLKWEDVEGEEDGDGTVCRASIADAGYYVIDDDGEGTFTVDYDLLVVDTAKTLEDAKRLAEEHWNSWAEIARGEAASFEQIVTDIDQSARIEELEAENAHLREQFAALAVPKHSRKDDTLVDQVNKWHCEPVRFFKGYEARFTEWHEGKSLDDDAAASLASSFRETGNGFHRLVDLLFPPPAPDDAPPPDPAQEQPAVDTGSSMRPVKAPKGMNKQDWMRRQSALAAESATTPPPATEPEPAESKAIDLDLPEFLRRTPAKPAPAPPGPAPAEEPDPAVVDAGLAWHQVKKDWFWVGHVGDADHTYALVVVPTRFYVPGGWRIIADYATDTERDLGFERTLDWAKQRAERDWLKSVKTWHPWWGYDVDPAFRNMVSKVKNWDDDTAPVSAPKRTKKPEPVA